MGTLGFRPMRTEERDAVAALWAECGLTRAWNDPLADIDFALSGPASSVLVAHADGTLAASVVVGHDGHRGTVYYVSVAPAMRGRRLGRAAMAAAEAWLRDQGVWKLNLMIRDDNAEVAAFYAALGYEIEPRTVMAKWLDPARNPANRKDSAQPQNSDI